MWNLPQAATRSSLPKSFLHDVHPVRIEALDESEGILRRTAQPDLELRLATSGAGAGKVRAKMLNPQPLPPGHRLYDASSKDPAGPGSRPPGRLRHGEMASDGRPGIYLITYTPLTARPSIRAQFLGYTP
jgi:hypothetical protein